MEILLYILPVVIVGGLIYAYGRRREQIGSLKVSVKKRRAQRDREAKAKGIESKKHPSDPDDVADAFDGLRSHSNRKR